MSFSCEERDAGETLGRRTKNGLEDLLPSLFDGDTRKQTAEKEMADVREHAGEHDQNSALSSEKSPQKAFAHVVAKNHPPANRGCCFARTCGQSWVWFRLVSLACRRIWIEDVMEPARTDKEDKEEEREKDNDKHHRLLCCKWERKAHKSVQATVL